MRRGEARDAAPACVRTRLIDFPRARVRARSDKTCTRALSRMTLLSGLTTTAAATAATHRRYTHTRIKYVIPCPANSSRALSSPAGTRAGGVNKNARLLALITKHLRSIRAAFRVRAHRWSGSDRYGFGQRMELGGRKSVRWRWRMRNAGEGLYIKYFVKVPISLCLKK